MGVCAVRVECSPAAGACGRATQHYAAATGAEGDCRRNGIPHKG